VVEHRARRSNLRADGIERGMKGRLASSAVIVNCGSLEVVRVKKEYDNHGITRSADMGYCKSSSVHLL
jgi:hypothetical protein